MKKKVFNKLFLLIVIVTNCYGNPEKVQNQSLVNVKAIKPPQITLLPRHKVEVFCNDEDNQKNEVLQLDCEFAGNPEPLIKWKKYEGHVPLKCRQTSYRGHGSLICPDFKQSDQGAYSCVAENSRGSSESQPKSIVKCSNSIKCKGFTVVSDDEIENCLDCYCSGKTTNCHGIRSSVIITEFPFPDFKVNLFASNEGDIIFLPSNNKTGPNYQERKSAQEIVYCQLSKDDFKETSFLKSYGRNINVPRYKEKTDFLLKAPDLIIRGNNISLIYKFNIISHTAEAVNVRFWPGNWYHLNNTLAKRKDLMKVLSNMDSLFIRCEYKKNNLLTWTNKAKIFIESSIITNKTDSASFVEKCSCPSGYVGLSCEDCAPGFVRKAIGNDFQCQKKKLLCQEGYIGENCTECDTSKNFYSDGKICKKTTCHPVGSRSSFPDSHGKCTCEENVEGHSCDKCKEGFFNVERKCLKCWCNDVVKACRSSKWFRKIISSTSLGGYNSSDGRNFWLLPNIFNGNRITSYGGFLNYTMKYIPNIAKQNSALTAELLTMNNYTIFYTHSSLDKSVTFTEKSWSVPLIELYWKKIDRSSITRGEFLRILSNIKAIYVESPYHLSSGQVNLTSVRLSSAEPNSDGQNELASSVEHCFCPEGYSGLSCETCTEGYYKFTNGSSTNCIKCDCPHCDPERGCLTCPSGSYRDNPEEEPQEICKPCPCNGNEKSCFKDSYGQIICLCKLGFTGIYCENKPKRTKESWIQLFISPRKLKNPKVGEKIRFNCSYVSDEKMKLTAKKIRTSGTLLPVNFFSNQSVENKFSSNKIFEFVLEEDIESIGCFLYNLEDKVVGHVKALIEDLIRYSEPVKITNCYSNKIDLVENEELDLICEAKGSPVPTINWFTLNKNGKMEQLETVDGVHYIHSANTNLTRNGTIYTCIAENSEGQKDKCTKALNIRKKCDFVRVNPSHLVVEEGDKISLQCKTTAKGPITWVKIESVLPHNRYTVNSGHLEIINSSLKDSGTYLCTVKTETGEISENASVIVEKKKLAPSVSILGNDKELNVGDNYEVHCLGTGNPTPSTRWLKVNDFLQTNVLLENKSLIINKANVKNSGLYACEGISSLGNDTAYIYINVIDKRTPPEVSVNSHSSVKILERENISLSCFAKKGIPEPNLEWRKEMSDGTWSKVDSKRILEFRNISVFNSGKYKCVGINSLGQHEVIVKINVQVPPKVVVSETKVLAHAGDNVIIKCQASGNPLPRIFWTGPPNKILRSVAQSSPDEKPSLKVIKGLMNFTLLSSMDGTSVSCIAENEAGRAEASIKLKVLQDQGSIEEIYENVTIGTSFDLHCELPFGNSTWEKVNGSIEGTICNNLNDLHIPSVQIQHGGKYICRSTDKHEKSFKKIINLNVVGFVPKFTRSHKSYLVVPVTLKTQKTLHIQISFMPTSETGTLLTNHNMELYLKKGKIHLNLYFDDNFFDIKCNETIVPDNWYSLVINISKFIDITIYDKNTSIIERKTINENHLVHLNVSFHRHDNFFVGGAIPETGIFSYSYKRLFLNKIPSFGGCISRLIIDGHEFHLVQEGSFSSNVILCNRCSDIFDPCEGKGKCFDAPTQYGFICVCPQNHQVLGSCPASCNQKGCETKLNLCKLINPCKRNDLHDCYNQRTSLNCKCAFGYSGTVCETVTEYSFCTSLNGFVKLPGYFLQRSFFQRPEIIKIEFTLKKPNGLLLWQGDNNNYVYIAVRNEFPEYVYVSQEVKLSVLGTTKIPVDKRAKITINRINNTAIMKIENENLSHQFKNVSKFVTNRVKGFIYLGNLPNEIRIFHPKLQGLNGCIHFVSFGNGPKVNLKEVALERVNVNFEPTLKAFSDEPYDSSEVKDKKD